MGFAANKWVKVGDLELPGDGEHIGFFALDRSEARPLRSHLEEFYGPLTFKGYRLKRLAQSASIEMRRSAG